MHPTRSRQCTLVEIGMGDRDAATKMRCDLGMKITERWLANNVIGRDPMNAAIEAAEMVARIDQRLKFEDDFATAKADNADLADAADTAASGFDINRHEIEDGRA